MLRFVAGVVVGAVITLVVHSKMDAKTEASVNKTVGTQVDTASTVALDGVQTGLAKANEGLTNARKPSNSK